MSFHLHHLICCVNCYHLLFCGVCRVLLGICRKFRWISSWCLLGTGFQYLQLQELECGFKSSAAINFTAAIISRFLLSYLYTGIFANLTDSTIPSNDSNNWQRAVIETTASFIPSHRFNTFQILNWGEKKLFGIRLRTDLQSKLTLSSSVLVLTLFLPNKQSNTLELVELIHLFSFLVVNLP